MSCTRLVVIAPTRSITVLLEHELIMYCIMTAIIIVRVRVRGVRFIFFVILFLLTKTIHSIQKTFK